MTDLTLHVDERGLYEVPVPAGETVTVSIEQTGPLLPDLELLAHESATPVYARPGTTVTVRDPKAWILPPGSWVSYVTATTLALTSEADATVSIVRRYADATR